MGSELLHTLSVALAGGAGAAIRYLLTRAVGHLAGEHRRHLATSAINVLGSGLLGALVGALVVLATRSSGGVGDLLALREVVGVGFLGGFTTFSTAVIEAVEMHRSGRRGAALAHAVVPLVGALFAAGVGMWLGGTLVG